MSRRSMAHELKTLVSSYHPLIVIETVEEQRARALLAEVADDLALPLYEWSILRGLHRALGATIAGTQEALGALRHVETLTGNGLYIFKDLAPHLGSPAAARALRDVAEKLTSTRSALVITGDPVDLAPDLDALTVRFELEFPEEEELREMVRNVLESMGARQRVRVDLSREDAQRVVRALSGLTLSQARQVIAQAIVDDGGLSSNAVQTIIRCKGELIDRAGILEFFPLEDNRTELGGFGRLKTWLERARIGFTPEAKALNLDPPKGILLVGVQGCGKSLAAKFVARFWEMPLLKLDAARLYDKYIGETEKRFRKATSLAEATAPVVLWIDEIEKSFARGGDGESDGGLSHRLLGSFLNWLQEKRQEVFVVGAANDLMSLPPEMLRKGRFDEIFFVDLPTPDERKTIFGIHLQLRKQDPSRFDVDALADETDRFSGAEIEQVVVSAIYRALHSKELLTTELLVDSARNTVPLAVTRFEDIERIRADAVGRFTPVA